MAKCVYIGVGNKAKKVKKAYIGVGGKAKLFYTSSQNTMIYNKGTVSSVSLTLRRYTATRTWATKWSGQWYDTYLTNVVKSNTNGLMVAIDITTLPSDIYESWDTSVGAGFFGPIDFSEYKSIYFTHPGNLATDCISIVPNTSPGMIVTDGTYDKIPMVDSNYIYSFSPSTEHETTIDISAVNMTGYLVILGEPNYPNVQWGHFGYYVETIELKI